MRSLIKSKFLVKEQKSKANGERGDSGRLTRAALWTEGEQEKRAGKSQAVTKGILPLSRDPALFNLVDRPGLS